MNKTFTGEAGTLTIDTPFADETLTLREWITLMRLRRGWTKADLARESGCSRTWLWRALECPTDDPKWVPLSPEIAARLITALRTADEAAA